MKISEAIDCYYNYISTERRMSAYSVRNYMAALESFSASLSVDEIEQVMAQDVRSWQMRMMDEGLSPATVKLNLTALRSWIRYLRRQKWLATDIMAKISNPKLAKRLPVFFREQEVERIYTDDELFPDTFEGRRDRLMLKVLYETGMRRSELQGLTEASVDFAAGTVKVLGKRDKERLIPIENELADNIKCYFSLKREIEGCSGAFFVQANGKPMTVAMIYNVVKKYMPLISNAEKISPHVFRHSFATHMLNEGADLEAIKDILGHANLGVTEIYTHVTREHLKEAYKHAHPRAQKKKN